jgi:hypothetical protein
MGCSGATLKFLSNNRLFAILFIIIVRNDRNQDKNSEENFSPE